MNTSKTITWIGLAAIALFSNLADVRAVPWTWSTLDYPGAVRTQASGIDGNNVVGAYHNAGEVFQGTGFSTDVFHGFLYNGSTWSTLDFPGAAKTTISGISGNRIVGDYLNAAGQFHSFLYDGTTWNTLDYPGEIGTRILGIVGNNIVGEYSGGGFLYNGTTWTTLNYPGAKRTFIRGVSGNNIVGYYDSGRGDTYKIHGFLYDGMTWTTLDYPGADPSISYNGDSCVYFYGQVFGIYENSIVGNYSGGGFLFDGTTWTTLNYPGSFRGISGDNIVGYYPDNGTYHGFLLTIPEPATLTLLALGSLMLSNRRWRRLAIKDSRPLCFLKTITWIGLAAIALFSNLADVRAVPWTWSTLDYPGAVRTQALGIDGNKIVGMYHNGDEVYHGFMFDGTTWATLNYPDSVFTSINGISGNNIVGNYKTNSGQSHGFLYDGTTWTTLDHPATGISGSNIIGDLGIGGLLYNGTTWTTLNYPGAKRTMIRGVSGNTIIGYYDKGRGSTSENHGFLYDGTTWTTLDFPGAEPQDVYNGDYHTYTYSIAGGISGNRIVGDYIGGGFLYDGSTWTTLDYPGAFTGISGDNIVGYYYEGSTYHGFLLTIPEPATLTLLALGSLMLSSRRWRRLAIKDSRPLCFPPDPFVSLLDNWPRKCQLLGRPE